MKVTEGRYRVREGDSPATVARALYGDPKLSSHIQEANNWEWEKDDILSIPNKRGVVLTVQEGEQYTLLHRRSGVSSVSEQAKEKFFLWNGGIDRPIAEGDEVFFLDLRVSYGY